MMSTSSNHVGTDTYDAYLSPFSPSSLLLDLDQLLDTNVMVQVADWDGEWLRELTESSVPSPSKQPANTGSVTVSSHRPLTLAPLSPAVSAVAGPALVPPHQQPWPQAEQPSSDNLANSPSPTSSNTLTASSSTAPAVDASSGRGRKRKHPVDNSRPKRTYNRRQPQPPPLPPPPSQATKSTNTETVIEATDPAVAVAAENELFCTTVVRELYSRVFSSQAPQTYNYYLGRVLAYYRKEKAPMSHDLTADIAFGFGVVLDHLNPERLEERLGQIGYAETTNRSGGKLALDPTRRYFRSSESCLPYVSLPVTRRPFDWSRSSDVCRSDDPHRPSFAQLSWYRPESLVLYRRPNDRSTISSVLTCDPRAESLPADAVSVPVGECDVSVLQLPMYVQVNAAFERLFGHSQLEIRSAFVHEGKFAIVRLMNTQHFLSLVSNDVKRLLGGHTEVNHILESVHRDGHRMSTLVHHRVTVSDRGFVLGHHLCWVPVPRAPPTQIEPARLYFA